MSPIRAGGPMRISPSIPTRPKPAAARVSTRSATRLDLRPSPNPCRAASIHALLIYAVLESLLRRLRRLVTGEVLAELAAVRKEMAANEAQMEAALLEIALVKKDEGGP